MNKERSAEQSISFNRAVNMVILCNDFFIEHQYCMVSFILTFRILCARKAFCEAPLISAKRQEFMCQQFIVSEFSQSISVKEELTCYLIND
jgi:hypothetical protein